MHQFSWRSRLYHKLLEAPPAMHSSSTYAVPTSRERHCPYTDWGPSRQSIQPDFSNFAGIGRCGSTFALRTAWVRKPASLSSPKLIKYCVNAIVGSVIIEPYFEIVVVDVGAQDYFFMSKLYIPLYEGLVIDITLSSFLSRKSYKTC